jgi:hypothetical protein
MHLNACWGQEVILHFKFHHKKLLDQILFHHIICKMTFDKSLEGQNGKAKNMRKKVSQRRHFHTRKGSNKSPKKSPSATPVTPVTPTSTNTNTFQHLLDPKNLTTTFDNIANNSIPSARQQPPRTSKIGGGVRFNFILFIYLFILFYLFRDTRSCRGTDP